jgi:hypothetical protein
LQSFNLSLGKVSKNAITIIQFRKNKRNSDMAGHKNHKNLNKLKAYGEAKKKTRTDCRQVKMKTKTHFFMLSRVMVVADLVLQQIYSVLIICVFGEAKITVMTLYHMYEPV